MEVEEEEGEVEEGRLLIDTVKTSRKGGVGEKKK